MEPLLWFVLLWRVARLILPYVVGAVAAMLVVGHVPPMMPPAVDAGLRSLIVVALFLVISGAVASVIKGALRDGHRPARRRYRPMRRDEIRR